MHSPPNIAHKNSKYGDTMLSNSCPHTLTLKSHHFFISWYCFGSFTYYGSSIGEVTVGGACYLSTSSAICKLPNGEKCATAVC